jgi:hypothetical protein
VEALVEKIPAGCITDGEDCRKKFKKEFREILS